MTKFFIKHAAIFRSLYCNLFSIALSLPAMAWITRFFEKGITPETLSGRSSLMLFLIYLTLPAALIFAVGIVYNYFDNHDRFNKRNFLNSENNPSLLSLPPYMIGFALSMLCSTVIFSDSYEPLLLYFGIENKTFARLLAVITMALLRLIQLHALRDKWINEKLHPLFAEKEAFSKHNNNKATSINPLRFILTPLIFSALFYFTIYISCGFVFEVSFALIIILASFWYMILAAIAVIILALFLVRFIYDISKRKKLIRKLAQIERDGLGKVKYDGPKYLSSLFSSIKFSVTVTDRKGKKYNCLVLSGGSVNAPMYFNEEEYIVEHGIHLRGAGIVGTHGGFAVGALYTDGMMGKTNPTNLISGHRKVYKLDFSADGKKVVILNPSPTSAFYTKGMLIKPIDTGEVIGDYTIYTATGFFNHIDRSDI